MSAVSKNVTPASSAAATTASTAGWSAIRPNGRQPTPTTETSMPLSPGRVRNSISALLDRGGVLRTDGLRATGDGDEPDEHRDGDDRPRVLREQAEPAHVVLLVVPV